MEDRFTVELSSSDVSYLIGALDAIAARPGPNPQRGRQLDLARRLHQLLLQDLQRRIEPAPHG